jgi:L-alanine-DL-glutamate epimerase-like enolase superfamily enzyme
MRDTDVVAIDVIDLDLALNEPFGIATGAQNSLENLLVRITLRSGARGLGEAAPFPAVNGETRAVARAALDSVRDAALGQDAARWRPLAHSLRERIPHAPSARCALETALLDALARHHRFPLARFFGGSERVLESDLTITTGTIEHARAAAGRIARGGYRTIKLKVGGAALADDIARVIAVIGAAPQCGLLLDANGAMATVDEALSLVREAQRAGGRIVLFEQPMGGRDLDAMEEISAKSPVPIAADESAGSLEDVLAIAHRRAAHAVNLKITKSGVVHAHDMALAARAHGLRLMIGGMVESDVAMSMSAHLAAGLGGFEWVDLDTPLWLRDSPVRPGYVRRGPVLELGDVHEGHGASVVDDAFAGMPSGAMTLQGVGP